MDRRGHDGYSSSVSNPDRTLAGRLDPLERTQVGELTPDDIPIVASVEVDSAGKTQRIGNYRVVGTLGRGGMGVVYDVVDEKKREFALKTIEARFLNLADSNAGHRFTHEIRVLKRIDHPSIVKLYDYGFAHHPMGYELTYFAMEKLLGETLDIRFKQGRLFEPNEAVRIVQSVAEALAYLETNGVLHRDIKPANLCLEPDGRTVLMDFGLARSKEFTRLTQTGHVIGTLGYMSPEALKGHEIDSTSDIFSLGVVLFEMVTGVQPFVEKDPTRRVVEIRNGLSWPEDIEVRADVKSLVEEMLAYDKTARANPLLVSDRCRSILTSRGPSPKPTAYQVPAAPIAPRQVVERKVEPTKSQPIRADEVSDARALARPFLTDPHHKIEHIEALHHPRGPTWLAAGGLVSLTAALTFVAGIILGRSTADTERVVVEVPAPPVIVQAPAPAPPQVIRSQPVPEPAPPPPVKREPPRIPNFNTAQAAYQYGDRALRDRHPDAAVVAFKEALRLNPAYAEVHRRLGDALLALGDIDEAQKSYKTYLALRPSAPDADDVRRVLDGI
jgi:serine/threonine protein kinase